MIYDFDKFTNDSSDDHPKYADGLDMEEETFEGLSAKEINKQEQICLELAAMFDNVDGSRAESNKKFLKACANGPKLTQQQLDELTAEVRRVFLDE